jgi:hypothetical protein
MCKENYLKTSPYQKRCKPCGKTARKIYIREYQKKRRGSDDEYRLLSNLKSRESYQRNIVTRRPKQRDYNRRVKAEVLRYYGESCACCGESRYEFLAIDHINGGGLKHRREEGFKSIYGWLKRKGFPEGFRTLCANCNSALGYFGFCPHSDLEAHQRLLDSLTLPLRPTSTV